MKSLKNFKITNAAGDQITFSPSKVEVSLRKAGVDETGIREVLAKINNELYDGISTREIHNRAFHLLNKKNKVSASRYKLKRAIYELGPTGYPFEKFVAAVLKHHGYKVDVGQLVRGACVSHEVDIVASKNEKNILIECKFHSEQGRHCNVKIPLYIHARYDDINTERIQNSNKKFSEGWVVTNTRFTKEALEYGNCVGLNLLSWDKPSGQSLKELIDHRGLYPITVSSLLSTREKEFLLARDVVLCKDILSKGFYLDHLNISENRKMKILKEVKMLCSKDLENKKHN